MLFSYAIPFFFGRSIMEVIDRLIFMVVFLVRVNILKGGYFFEKIYTYSFNFFSIFIF